MADLAVGEDQPFVRYRERLDSYAVARAGGLSDEHFVDIVSQLDEAVAAVDGAGFTATPVVDGAELAGEIGLDVDLVVKVEIDNVSGSHKARHLFGVAVQMLVDEALGRVDDARLAIASCGNAALGAGVIARALDRPLDVFVPTWADATVVDELHRLGANVATCERRAAESGDPCYLRFGEAVAAGARGFSVQGTDTPTTFDGGRTLAWELAEQAPDLDVVYVQVGGGALATAVGQGLGPGVRLMPVQAEGCAPLRRAWDLLGPEFDLDAAAREPERFMWPWSDPSSAATGILDDVTYDWLPLLERTLASEGAPVVASESTVVSAHRIARAITGLDVSATGSAGLAGLMTDRPTSSKAAVLFTGVER